MSINYHEIKAVVFDFSKVLLFARDTNYKGDLNPLHRDLLEKNSVYPFLNYFYLNQELLNYLNKTNFERLYIFTSGSIQNAPAIGDSIRKVFKAIYSAEQMGVKKSEPQSYVKLCENIGLAPNKVLFIDDTQRNLDAARSAGLATVPFTGNSPLYSVLDKLR